MRDNATGIDDVQVATQGDIPAAAVADAEETIRSLVRYSTRPIAHARVRLTRTADPAVARPVIAQGNLYVDGRLARAQVAARTAREAVDLLQEKLRGRLTRLARHREARRGSVPGVEPHQWSHGQEPTHRPDHFPRPAEERRVVRHKAYQLARTSPDDAAFDMDLLGYDFHLFADDETGQDAVVYRAGPTGYRLAELTPPPATWPPPTTPLSVSGRSAPRLCQREAVARLDATGQPFLFYADLASGRGRLLYRRYDGHYGLITPAA